MTAQGRTAVGGPPAGGLTRWAEARLVAALTFRDLLRRPGGWVATLLTGVLFAVLLGALGLTGERVQDRAEGRSFKVAIGGDLDGAARTIDALRIDRLVLIPDDDVEAAVTNSETSAGIVFPDDVDRRVDAGDPVELQIFRRESQNNSEEAFRTIAIRLQEIELARLEGRSVAASAATEDLEVVISELPRDERITRIQLARQLAPIGALLCIGVVASAAAVLGAARERRAIEPLLALPLQRASIALGISMGTFPVACLQVLAAIALLVLTAAIPATIGHQPLPTVLAMLGAASASSLLLAMLATGAGVYAGAIGTGTDDAVSLGDLLSVPFVVVGVVVFAAPTIGGSYAFAIPILGGALVLRDSVAGTFHPLDIALATASTVAVAAALVGAAGRALDDERRVVRAIR